MVALGHDDRITAEDRWKRQGERRGQRIGICVRRIDQHKVETPSSGGAPKKLDCVAADRADERGSGAACDDIEVGLQNRSHARIAFHESDVRGTARKRLYAQCSRTGKKIQDAKLLNVAEDREQRLTHLVAGRSSGATLWSDQSATFEFSGDNSHPAQPVAWAAMVKLNVVPTMVMNMRTRHTVTGRCMATLAAVLLLSISAAGCGDDATNETTAGETSDNATNATGTTTKLLPANPIDKGLHGNIPAKLNVVLIARTDDEYAKLEKKVRGPGFKDSWKSVDFKSRMVITVQTRPGGGGEQVTINGVEEKDGGVLVHATHIVPGTNCIVTAILSHPFAVADAPRLDGPPKLRLKTITRDC